MATAILPKTAADKEPGKLVEMNWDPITRIVGSLGIFTKIDFAKKRVAECYSTSSIFRGYSIFMKGKDPRDAHFITSRICGICGDNHATCAVLRAEHGLRRRSAGARRVDRQSGRSGRIHVRPQHLPGQPGRRRLLRADGQGDQPRRAGEKAEKTEAPNAAAHGYKTIGDIMRGPQPVRRRLLPRDAASQPHDARDVLPDGRAARPSVDLVSGRRRDGAHRAALHRLPRRG